MGKSKLILKAISMHKESQRLHNKGRYQESRKLRIEANRILNGFSGSIVADHFALFHRGER